VKNTIIREVKKVLLAKIEDQNDELLFDKQCVIHKEFVHKGKTVNTEFYRQVLERSMNFI
jgi:hypothetical protein